MDMNIGTGLFLFVPCCCSLYLSFVVVVVVVAARLELPNYLVIFDSLFCLLEARD